MDFCVMLKLIFVTLWNPFKLLDALVVIELDFGISFSDLNLHLMVLEINKTDSLKGKKLSLPNSARHSCYLCQQYFCNYGSEVNR